MGDVLITQEFRNDIFAALERVYIMALKEVSPVISGDLKRGWNVYEVEPLVYVITNSTEYAAWLDEGTGIYATQGAPDYQATPGRKRIGPKTKKALAFSIGGTQIVVKSIAGIKPLMMIQKVASSKKVQKDFDKELEKIFEKHLFANFDS